MDKSSTSQVYGALPPGFIRLLSLQPATNRDARVECHLSPARIDERPYEALSYVWGPENPNHGILVDGEEVNVRSNLYAALKELRLKDQPRTLWIDSVCINQADINERNHQVRQMGTIYSSTNQVIIWLGEGDVETDIALDFIDCLSKLDVGIALCIIANNGLRWEEREQIFSTLGMHHGHNDHERIVGGLTKLMNNAWWTRVWTVQEIVLAGSALLRCGSKSASWGHLVQLSKFAIEVSHHNTINAFGGRPMVEAVFDEWSGQVLGLYVATSVLTDLSYRLSNGLETSLQQMILQLRFRRATDPLDVIYALLGITTEKTTIEIDYGKSKKEVYKNAMKIVLELDRVGHAPLDLLQDSYVQRDPTLPSWVPDFSTLYSLKTTSLSVTGIGASLVLGASLYNTSLGDDGWGPPKFLDGDDAMQMEGLLVDEVTVLGEACPRFDSGWEERDKQLRLTIGQWKKLITEEAGHEIAGCSRKEAFWRTVTFDLLLVDRSYFAGNPNRRDVRLPKVAVGMPPSTSKEEEDILEGIIDAPIPKTVLEKLSERRFFVTKTGYMGLGPASMKTGDIVCVLRG